MKQTLLVILSIIVINTLHAQGAEYKSPLPKFTPYQNVTVNDSNEILNYDAKELGLDQPARWLSVDPMADKYPGWSPYVYCHNDPMSRIDPNGLWDIKVYCTPNRGKNETGYAQLFDRNGKLLYSFETKNRGAGGRDRLAINGDTPTGTYKINGWEEKSDKQAYGPNKVLRLTPLNGEAKDAEDAGRGGILQHGGRQEGPNGDPDNLATTNGCTRVYDKDQENLINITNELENNDPDEKPGSYTVEDALQYKPIIVTPNKDDDPQKKDENK